MFLSRKVLIPQFQRTTTKYYGNKKSAKKMPSYQFYLHVTPIVGGLSDAPEIRLTPNKSSVSKN